MDCSNFGGLKFDDINHILDEKIEEINTHASLHDGISLIISWYFKSIYAMIYALINYPCPPGAGKFFLKLTTKTISCIFFHFGCI